MNPKKFFHYFLLPIITILLIPYLMENEVPDKFLIVLAIFCGLLLGGIRCLWDRYQNKKQQQKIAD